MINNNKKKNRRKGSRDRKYQQQQQQDRLNGFVDISFYRVYASISKEKTQNKWRTQNKTEQPKN